MPVRYLVETGFALGLLLTLLATVASVFELMSSGHLQTVWVLSLLAFAAGIYGLYRNLYAPRYAEEQLETGMLPDP